MSRYHRVLDDLVEEALIEHLTKKKKDSDKEKKPSSPRKGLGFFEGLVVAYIAQVMYGPLTKILEVYLQAHGVH